MTPEERNILIVTCLLKTNYSEEYLSNLSDEELEEFYDRQISESISKR